MVPVEMAKKKLQTLAGNSKNISDLQGAMNLAILDGIVDERKFYVQTESLQTDSIQTRLVVYFSTLSVAPCGRNFRRMGAEMYPALAIS